MTNLFATLLIFIGLLSAGGLTSFAEESKEYDSKGSVGFYGSYDYPEPSSDTTDSREVPKTSGNIKINAPKNSIESRTRRLLPKTGEYRKSDSIILGVISIMGLILFLIKKKGDIKNESTYY